MKLFLSLSLLCATVAVHAHDEAAVQTQTMPQDAYMVQLYRNIAEFCKTHENPSSILLAVPLELVIVSGALPQEMQDKITALTQAMSQNDGLDIDNNAAMNLVTELIPYMELIDGRIATSIKEVQALGVRIIAISPFMPQHADAMLARMNRLGLDFQATAVYKKEMPIDDEDGNRVAVCKSGVVFMNDYLQLMSVLQTMVNNAPGEIQQLIFAAPMQAQANAEQANP